MNVRVRLIESLCSLSTVVAMLLPGQLVAQVQLEQVTYIGGADFDRAQGCAIDANGFIYVAGNTKSADLPVTTGVPFAGDQDAFLAKFSPDLRQLVALGYFGGAGEDRGYGVAVDGQGNIYLSGITASPVFPTTPNAFDRTRDGPTDVFLAKFSPDLKTVLFSTLLGGDGGANTDWTRGGIELDGQNNIYLPGRAGRNFPVTSNAYQRVFAGGQIDAFVTRVAADGSGLQWSTLAGGSGEDNFYGNLVHHTDGSVFAAGVTNSTDFPVVPGAYDNSLDGSGYAWWDGEGVVARFSADGSGLLYSTYLWGGVAGNDALAVDPNGRAHLVANVRPALAANVPVSANAAQATYGGGKFDATVAVLSADGSRVEAATFLGGSGEEEGSGLALDSAGNIYTGGMSYSPDFPVTTGSNVVQAGKAGAIDTEDAYFAVLDPQLRLLYSTYLGGPGTDRVRCAALAPGNKVVISGDTDGGFPVVGGGYDVSHNGGRDGFIALFSGVPAGTGANPVPDITVTDPVAPVSDLTLGFGDVAEGSSARADILVSNNGTGDLALGQVGQGDSLAAPFAIRTDNCSGQVLTPGAICRVAVAFTPTAQQAFNDSLDFPSDDPDEASVTVSLSGTGVAVSIVPSSSGGGGGGCSLAGHDSGARQAGAWGLLLLFLAGLAGRGMLRRPD